jgi:uncharacterized protein with GYD domain
MPTYVLMTKLGSRSLDGSGGRRAAGQRWKAKVESVVPGIKWVAHYALLGPYDFMDVYEAPDDAAAMRVSLLSRELGAVSAESWPAMPYDKFLPLMEQVEKNA